MSECWVCDRYNIKDEIFFDNKLCFSILDSLPVTQGHALIFPKRHIENIFDATDDEILAMLKMTRQCFENIKSKDTSVAGYNIGINCGLVAGQSTRHLHIHLIPRRKGDVENPIGGVRCVIPNKQYEPEIFLGKNIPGLFE